MFMLLGTKGGGEGGGESKVYSICVFAKWAEWKEYKEEK